MRVGSAGCVGRRKGTRVGLGLLRVKREKRTVPSAGKKWGPDKPKAAGESN